MADQQTSTLKENLYLSRYSYAEKLIAGPPDPKLSLIVTIPCYNEPDLIRSLQALHQCTIENLFIEVIVLINEGINAPSEISQQNSTTFKEAQQWAKAHADKQRQYHIIYKKDLPAKHAGVGLARKLAMDEAVRRFEVIGKPEGVIVCFDADSSCDKNYLQGIHDFFLQNPKAPGCSIYFEHPLSGPYPAEVYEAIVDYELFLRYYVNGLRYAGFPYGYETIGSSMAVRSAAYQKQGGMNRRKAGEDFYFLHRIIPLGHFGEVNNVRVIPSPRRSDRVPFGTGKAVNDWLQKKQLLTYSPKIFAELKIFLAKVDQLYELAPENIAGFVNTLPASIRGFLLANDFDQQLMRMQHSASSPDVFLKHFYHWFDGFKVLKYVHYTRDHFYKNIPVKEAAVGMAKKLDWKIEAIDSSKELLKLFRDYDRAVGRGEIKAAVDQ